MLAQARHNQQTHPLSTPHRQEALALLGALSSALSLFFSHRKQVSGRLDLRPLWVFSYGSSRGWTSVTEQGDGS